MKPDTKIRDLVMNADGSVRELPSLDSLLSIAAELKKTPTSQPLRLQESSKSFSLKLEPYDPDAQDGDGDGIVQDGTAWERPAGARILNVLGQEIERGLVSGIRPEGVRVVGKNGEDLDFTPSYMGKPGKLGPEARRPETITGPLPKLKPLKDQGLQSVDQIAHPPRMAASQPPAEQTEVPPMPVEPSLPQPQGPVVVAKTRQGEIIRKADGTLVARYEVVGVPDEMSVEDALNVWRNAPEFSTSIKMRRYLEGATDGSDLSIAERVAADLLREVLKQNTPLDRPRHLVDPRTGEPKSEAEGGIPTPTQQFLDDQVARGRIWRLFRGEAGKKHKVGDNVDFAVAATATDPKDAAYFMEQTRTVATVAGVQQDLIMYEIEGPTGVGFSDGREQIISGNYRVVSVEDVPKSELTGTPAHQRVVLEYVGPHEFDKEPDVAGSTVAELAPAAPRITKDDLPYEIGESAWGDADDLARRVHAERMEEQITEDAALILSKMLAEAWKRDLETREKINALLDKLGYNPQEVDYVISEDLLLDVAKTMLGDAKIEDGVVADTLEEMRNRKIFVAASEFGITQMLADGRWKTQFESGDTASGYLNPEGRAAAEEEFAGIPRDLDPALRPGYGFVPAAGEDRPMVDEAMNYGHAAIELKDDVKDKSTICIGDSLGTGALPIPMSDDKFDDAIATGDVAAAVAEQWETTSVHTELAVKRLEAQLGQSELLGELEEIIGSPITQVGQEYVDKAFDSGMGYYEVQIHGGFSVDDVESIVWPGRSLEDVPLAVRTLAEQRGIPIRMSASTG